MPVCYLSLDMSFFEISNTFFTLWGYSVSYLEFFGLVSGLVAVSLSAVANVWSWPNRYGVKKSRNSSCITDSRDYLLKQRTG